MGGGAYWGVWVGYCYHSVSLLGIVRWGGGVASGGGHGWIDMCQ